VIGRAPPAAWPAVNKVVAPRRPHPPLPGPRRAARAPPQALEAFVTRSPGAARPHLGEILGVALEALRHDPNFADDMDDGGGEGGGEGLRDLGGWDGEEARAGGAAAQQEWEEGPSAPVARPCRRLLIAARPPPARGQAGPTTTRSRRRTMSTPTTRTSAGRWGGGGGLTSGGGRAMRRSRQAPGQGARRHAIRVPGCGPMARFSRRPAPRQVRRGAAKLIAAVIAAYPDALPEVYAK
jgi:hypothetical protein